MVSIIRDDGIDLGPVEPGTPREPGSPLDKCLIRFAKAVNAIGKVTVKDKLRRSKRRRRRKGA